MSAERARLGAWAGAALVAALAVFGGRATAAGGFDGPTIRSPRLTPDFALRDQSGRRIELYALHGKVVLLTFLYTHCPDACPLTAERLDAAVRSLGKARSRVAIVAVSVDPAGDTKASLRTFFATHRLLPQWHYLTGPRALLRPIWRAYGVQSVARAGDRVDHTLYTLLLDRRGRSRVLYDSTAPESYVAHDVRLLLAR